MSSDAEIHQARRRIESAYDPELLRAAGHRLVDLLAEHLSGVQDSRGDVLPWRDPAQNIREAAALDDAALDDAAGSAGHMDPLSLRERVGVRADRGQDEPTVLSDLAEPSPPAPLPEGEGRSSNGPSEDATEPTAGREALAEHFARLVQTMLGRGLNLHHPGYIGHQVAASVPLAGLFDAVGSVTNQVMAIYDMGPWATAVEWAMVQRLGQEIGWLAGRFSGLATHGGSLANLTALLTARNVCLKDSWERGTAGAGAPPVLVVHADAHYCVSRAAGILGLGTNQVVRVGLDARRRMDPRRLEDVLRDCQARKQPIVAVVACSCSTPVGAFDPLEEVADTCGRHGVWLHVDAAHGGAACLSPRHRHLVAGLARADSVAWDAHKMLFVPGLCAFLFYRDRAHAFEAFRQDAPYLFDPAAPGLAQYDSALRTVECTKRAAAFGLWGLWSLFGPQLFADLVDVTFAMGRTFFEKLSAADDFVPLHEPECNIVVFRHVPAALRGAPPEVLGQFQLDLRRRLIESGEFYVVSTLFDGAGALRVTIINPLTTPDDLDRLLEAIRQIGGQLLKPR